MQTVLKRVSKRFNQLSAGFENKLTYWVAVLVMLAIMPTTASDEVDCRAARSGYVSGDPVPDTCTVQLTLDDAETEMIDSLRAKYQDFPVRCRLGEYF